VEFERFDRFGLNDFNRTTYPGAIVGSEAQASSIPACELMFRLSFRLIFLWHRQLLLIGIHHKHGQELRGFRLARVFTNAVKVTGHLGEISAGVIGDDRSIVHRTSNRSLENGRINES
jgi:hypothetical protein